MKFTVEEIHTIITALMHRKYILTKEIESISAEAIKAINEKEISKKGKIDTKFKEIS